MMLRCSTLCIAAVLAMPAYAQTVDVSEDTAPVAQQTQTAPDDYSGEILVTARRQTERLQDVPVAVTAFDGEALRKQNITSAADLSARVPSLQTRSGSASRDQVAYRLRGQGQGASGGEPSVVVYFLDVPTIAAGPGLFYDLANVQVLKGPQGTLFGRNTTGGAILLNPQRPKDELGGYLDASIGNYNLARIQGALNLPVVEDWLAVRFAFDVNHRDGFTEDLETGDDLDDRNYQAWRVSVLLTPTEGLENYFVYEYFHSRNNGGGTVLTAVRPGSSATAFFPSITEELLAQQERGPRKVRHSTGQNFQRDDARSITNILSYEIADNLTIKSILGYRKFITDYTADSDGSIGPFVERIANGTFATASYGYPPSNISRTAELNLSGKLFDGTLDWIIGGYYQKIKPATSRDADAVINFGRQLELSTLRRDTTKAVYGHATLDLASLTDGLSLSGGLRYTKDRRKLNSRTIVNGLCATVGAIPPDCQRYQEASFDAVTYDVSINYKPAPNTLFYLASRRGYKSGGFNNSVPVTVQTVYGPEHVQDVEAGIKTSLEFLGMRGHIDAAYYYSEYKDIQRSVTQFDPASQQTFAVVSNSGRATIQGVELEGTLLPTNSLRLSGFYAFTDAKYKVDALRGVAFQSTPRHKFGLTAQYEFDLGNLGQITPGAMVSYQSLIHHSNTSNDYDRQEGYALADLRLDWENVLSYPIDVGLFVTNLTNKTYEISSVNLYTSAGVVGTLYGEPRMYGMRLRYRL